MLEVLDFSLERGGAPILEGASLHLQRGGFGILVGRSGCGKTSFFKALAGLLPRRAGQIRWRGKSVENLAGLAASMQQKDLLLPWATLEENVLLPALVSGRVGPEERNRARELLKRFGLEGFEKFLPNQVSGGMRQRCALARTVLSGREILLLDEPLSALDALTRSHLQREIFRLQQEFGRTILMVTHDVEEALLLADRIFVFHGVHGGIEELLNLSGTKPRETDAPAVVKNRKVLLEALERGHSHAA
ncbi:MAG TPA: ABC transporter ATP-binding protein [Synergistales bacterium]|nr:ABC transporter ATP-binding protein [Synergistales bacterium]